MVGDRNGTGSTEKVTGLGPWNSDDTGNENLLNRKMGELAVERS